MSTITAFEHITLDGVMQGPGRADEDTRAGFTHGGWANGYQDDISMKYAGEGMRATRGLLFGRRSYEDVLGYWTSSGPNPFVDALVGSDKFVVSRGADTPLAYANSELLAGEAVTTVAALKDQYPHDLLIMGSGELVRSLHAAGLIDRYTLLIHPLVLGSGTRLFANGDRVDLKLERSLTTSTGVVIAEFVAAL
ncbi:Dihydrofolate reductase [Arthrobacter sp. yr096]|uniref:dihydrofolate reductase family protein n=1 Tax=unclassified Arthrobacter TaxID=235627 RepID=UPI00089527E1|nr:MULTISPECIES: dihydrofolate reductase family protein [unclassified Arthrobacter]SDW58536.1 Dihydrofolate reductase [Arthrobacter sp. cf158]SEI98774.1 Dihydrofolate reductase [Arthrobacter sp. yr096]